MSHMSKINAGKKDSFQWGKLEYVFHSNLPRDFHANKANAKYVQRSSVLVSNLGGRLGVANEGWQVRGGKCGVASEREPAGGLRGGGPESRASPLPAGAAQPGGERGRWGADGGRRSRPGPWTSPRQATDAEDAAEVEAEDEGPRNKLLPNEEEERSGLIHDQNLKDKLAV